MKNQKVRASYSWRQRTWGGAKVLVIIDFNEGGMSVTNNAEGVLTFVASVIGEEIYDDPIIYRDSDGIYDGIEADGSSVSFYSIRTRDEDEAMKEAVKRIKGDV